MRPAGRKSGEQKAARQGVRWARKAMWAVGQRFCCSFFVPTMRTYLLCAQFRRRGVKVRRLSVGRGALRPAVRKSGEQKTARQGVRRARKMVQGESAEACEKTAERWARLWAALCAPFRRRSRSARFAAGAFACAKSSPRGVCRACFIITAHKPGRGAGAFAAAQGCKRVRCFRCAGCGKSGAIRFF